MSKQSELRIELEHMFASAWQDGVHHLNPKYLRRDTLFTDRALELITAYTDKKIEAVLDRLAIEVRASDYIGIAETIQAERNKLKEAEL